MKIAVINQSTFVHDSDVDLMVEALKIQMDLHVAPAWNQKAPTIVRSPAGVTLPEWVWTIAILDDSTQAGALGYHSLDNDVVDAFIFVKPVLDGGGVVLFDPNNPQNVSVSSVVSHEIIEMFGDRFANAWCDGPSIAQGSTYALELCDPVQGDSVAVTVQGPNGPVEVSVSNFVFPSWFNPEAKSPENMPFDFMKKLTAPFTMTAGGYMIVRSGGPETEQQVLGEVAPPAWRLEHQSSEWYRR